jgi:glutaredoxin-like YruB-family protein
MEKVILYSMQGWPACVEIKSFFDENNVDYEDKDVRKDAQARNDLIKVYKQRSVPTAIIGDEVVVGFREERLKELLDL